MVTSNTSKKSTVTSQLSERRKKRDLLLLFPPLKPKRTDFSPRRRPRLYPRTSAGHGTSHTPITPTLNFLLPSRAATAVQGAGLFRDASPPLRNPPGRAHGAPRSRCHCEPSAALRQQPAPRHTLPAARRRSPHTAQGLRERDNAAPAYGTPAAGSAQHSPLRKGPGVPRAVRHRLRPPRRGERQHPHRPGRCPCCPGRLPHPSQAPHSRRAGSPARPYRAAPAAAGAGRPAGGARRCPALSRAIPRSRGRAPPPHPWSPPPAEPECARRAPLPGFSAAGAEEEGGRGRAPLSHRPPPPPALKRPRYARHSGAPWRRRARGSRDFLLGSARRAEGAVPSPAVPSPAVPSPAVPSPAVPSPAGGFTGGFLVCCKEYYLGLPERDSPGPAGPSAAGESNGGWWCRGGGGFVLPAGEGRREKHGNHDGQGCAASAVYPSLLLVHERIKGRRSSDRHGGSRTELGGEREMPGGFTAAQLSPRPVAAGVTEPGNNPVTHTQHSGLGGDTHTKHSSPRYLWLAVSFVAAVIQTAQGI
ncbi:basic proline-rich protein-like [Pseudopipra pipra]|uniref:basic proline-rich protein-like n=1 Tax=Pseudopipra pipra TaxID=415032 RepID=UPI00313981DA